MMRKIVMNVNAKEEMLLIGDDGEYMVIDMKGEDGDDFIL